MKIPYIEGTTEKLNNFEPTSSSSASPEAFGAGVGKALEGVGQAGQNGTMAVGEAYFRMQERDRETKVATDFSTKIAPEFRRLDEEFRTKTAGINTLENYEDYKRRAGELRDKFVGQYTDPLTARAIERLTNGRYETTMGSLSGYFTEQKLVAEKSAHEGVMDTLKLDLQDNFDNPERVRQILASGEVEKDRRAEQAGWSTQEGLAEKAAWRTSVYTNVGKLKIQRNPVEAKDWLDEQGDNVPKAVRTSMEAELRPLLAGQRSAQKLAALKANISGTGTLPPVLNIDGQGFGGGLSEKDRKRYENPPPETMSLISKYADLNSLPVSLVQAVVFHESRYDPKAVSPSGARGLMQLMPPTAAELGVTMANIHDPETNIAAGTRYLAQQIKRFKGNIPLALAAYNAGAGNLLGYTRKDGTRDIGAIARAKKKYGEDASLDQILSELPRPKETVPYVKGITGVSQGKTSLQQQEAIAEASVPDEGVPLPKGAGGFVKAIVGQTTGDIPPPPPFLPSGRPANGSRELAEVHYYEATLIQAIEDRVASGEWTREEADTNIGKIKAEQAGKREMIIQRQKDDSSALMGQVRAGQIKTLSDILDNPEFRTLYDGLTEDQQTNLSNGLMQAAKTESSVETAMSNEKISRAVMSITGGRGIEGMNPTDQSLVVGKAQDATAARATQNYKDLSDWLDQEVVLGVNKRVSEALMRQPAWQQLDDPSMKERLLGRAANAEAKYSSNKVDHFTKIALITKEPDLLPKLEGWSDLQGSEQSAVLSVALQARGTERGEKEYQKSKREERFVNDKSTPLKPEDKEKYGNIGADAKQKAQAETDRRYTELAMRIYGGDRNWTYAELAEFRRMRGDVKDKYYSYAMPFFSRQYSFLNPMNWRNNAEARTRANVASPEARMKVQEYIEGQYKRGELNSWVDRFWYGVGN